MCAQCHLLAIVIGQLIRGEESPHLGSGHHLAQHAVVSSTLQKSGPPLLPNPASIRVSPCHVGQRSMHAGFKNAILLALSVFTMTLLSWVNAQEMTLYAW